MRHFLIKYRLRHGSAEDWHRRIAEFVSALDTDPDLKGRIAYWVLKPVGGDDYYHLATVMDDKAVGILQAKDFFKRHSERTRLAAGEDVKGVPLEIVAETKDRT
jgi:hypothetical protein